MKISSGKKYLFAHVQFIHNKKQKQKQKKFKTVTIIKLYVRGTGI